MTGELGRVSALPVFLIAALLLCAAVFGVLAGPTRKALAGKANVHRAPTNCGPTIRGLEGLDQWLGDGRWDVIHFNWGLHDLKYMGPTGKNLADPSAAGSRIGRQCGSTSGGLSRNPPSGR